MWSTVRRAFFRRLGAYTAGPKSFLDFHIDRLAQEGTEADPVALVSSSFTPNAGMSKGDIPTLHNH